MSYKIKENQINILKNNIIDKDIYNKKINLSREIFLTKIGLIVVLVSSSYFFLDIGSKIYTAYHNHYIYEVCEQITFVIIITFLIYGNFLYQLARIGYFKRLLLHCRENWDELSKIFNNSAPSLTILIPSYKEDPKVIKQSLLSAALQEYPNKRVVLLIDDPPNPQNQNDLDGLLAARQLPFDIQNLLQEPAEEFYSEYQKFIDRTYNQLFNSIEEGLYLSRIYRKVATWFIKQALNYSIKDHTDKLFVKKIFLDTADLYKKLAEELFSSIQKGSKPITKEAVLKEYQRIVSLFKVEITSFERKKYVNLSHASNKAMNLNSYISLLGKNYYEIPYDDMVYLKETKKENATISISKANYLITLDADSILCLDYALRLIYYMEKNDSKKVAVIQTPYTAVPNPTSILERIAGATTDIQYIIHQGFTKYQATFWVGANALLRTSALKDISIETEERGFKIKKYIQDRTVIEDTESSVDLISNGWSLYNYPERLSFSATPADFGALLIQRRRWANGGLIILPKLLDYIFNRFNFFHKLKEGFMRFHYLTSISAVNIGLPILLFYPFEENLENLWLPFTAIPYFFFYGRDLIHAGYKLTDIFRVYALNLMLIPVNLGGVLKSIHQALSGKTIPFKRTPKIKGRTSAPPLYIMSEYLILTYCYLCLLFDIYREQPFHGTFLLINCTFFFYAIVNFIGIEDSKEDLCRIELRNICYELLLNCRYLVKSLSNNMVRFFR